MVPGHIALIPSTLGAFLYLFWRSIVDLLVVLGGWEGPLTCYVKQAVVQ